MNDRDNSYVVLFVDDDIYDNIVKLANPMLTLHYIEI